MEEKGTEWVSIIGIRFVLLYVGFRAVVASYSYILSFFILINLYKLFIVGEGKRYYSVS